MYKSRLARFFKSYAMSDFNIKLQILLSYLTKLYEQKQYRILDLEGKEAIFLKYLTRVVYLILRIYFSPTITISLFIAYQILDFFNAK